MVRTLSTMRSCSVSGHLSATANWTCYVEMQLVVTCGKLDRRWTPWLSENTLPEPRSPHPTRSSWPTAVVHHSVTHAGYQVLTSTKAQARGRCYGLLADAIPDVPADGDPGITS